MMIQNDSLKIGSKIFKSRLMIGTGKYQSSKIMVDSLESSKSEIVTVAIRRIISVFCFGIIVFISVYH